MYEERKNRINDEEKDRMARFLSKFLIRFIALSLIVGIGYVGLTYVVSWNSTPEYEISREEARLTAVADYLDTEPVEIIIEDRLFSSNYIVIHDGTEYKAVFEYDDQGYATITNLARTQ